MRYEWSLYERKKGGEKSIIIKNEHPIENPHIGIPRALNLLAIHDVSDSLLDTILCYRTAWTWAWVGISGTGFNVFFVN